MAHITVPDESTVTTFAVTASQSVFSIPWTCFAKTDIQVLVGGVALLQTDFTFVGNPGTEGGFDGATITLNTPVSSITVIIYRAIIVQRTEDFGAGPVSSRDRNTALDRLTAMIQDQDRRNDESLRVPVGETVPAIPSASERANKVLGFDVFGNPIATTGGGGGGGGGSDAVPLIASVAALRATTWPDGRPAAVMLLSNHITGDGGGFFRWDSASVLNDNNGGTRVKEDATATGRWIRQVNDGWVHVSWFGLVLSADEATATANTTAMQRALNSGFNVRLPSGSFWCGYVTQSTPGQIVEGDRGRTVWRHPVAATANLIEMTSAAIGVIWRNFRIAGNSANVVYNYNASEFVWFGTDVTIDNIEMKDCQSMGARAIGPAHRYKVTRCRFENCGDWGFFANDAGLGGAIDGIIDGNTVLNFGLQGLDSVALGARSDIGGTKIINNTVKQTVEVAGPNSTLAIECWTNSNNAVIANNFIDMAVAGDFGLSATGYGMAVTGNIVIGTTAYGIEIVDGACTVVSNVVRSPKAAGIAINLNPGHSNPGDICTVTGNTIENITTTAPEFAGLVLAGLPGTTPIAVTIAGNTFHGPGRHMMLSDELNGYTISGNTFYNTGGTSDAISLGGDNGVVTGNNFFRVSAVGTGNQAQALGIGGNCTGITVTGNRFAGNSRMTNGIVVQAGATDVYLSNNHFSGIISNSIFSVSTSPTIVVAGGHGNLGVGMNAANRVVGFTNTTDNQSLTQNIPLGISSYTVANLPIDVVEGQIAFATNGRKTGEGAGSGTGVLVIRDNSNWRVVSEALPVVAS